MGAKFRLSSRIDTVLSQNLEDHRNKDKNRYPTHSKTRIENAGTQRTKDMRNISTVPRTNALSKESRENEVITKQVRALPYVDVPQLKPSLPPMTAPVKTNIPVNVSARSMRMTSETVQSDSDVITNDRNSMDEIPKREPVYQSRAPVETGLDIEGIVDKVLDLEINIPLRSLAGVSGTIQKEIRRQVTKTRQVADDKKKAHLASTEMQNLTNVDSLPMSTCMIMEEVSDEIPEGHLVASDPVLQYLSENKDAKPSELIVASASEPLRAIYANINRIGQEECLLDDGSMIVSMSKETATQLGLVWDPAIKINMESASNHVEQTLGLAKNVCFRTGGIEVYLQVHILENPPYRILLGRPFAALTNSITKTHMNGSSEITLTDPNTKRMVTMSTYQRGVGPEELQKQRQQGF